MNAAGITQDDFLLNMEEEQFDRVVRVNLKVAALLVLLELRCIRDLLCRTQKTV